MTEPSEQAKRKACELANAIAEVYSPVEYSPVDCEAGYSISPPLRALALHLDEVDRVARRIVSKIYCGDMFSDDKELRFLMLPDLVDPLEEVFAMLDRLTPADFRAELAKRGYKLVKETPDDRQ